MRDARSFWRGAVSVAGPPVLAACGFVAARHDVLTEMDKSRLWLIFQMLLSAELGLAVLAVTTVGRPLSWLSRFRELAPYSYTMYIAGSVSV